MRNYSKVYLLSRTRQDFQLYSMTNNRSGEGEDKYEYSNTVFFIPADAKMDGL